MTKKDYLEKVAVDGQNVAYTHGEFILKKKGKKGKFFSFQGLIDLVKILKSLHYKPLIFLPEFTRVSKFMQKNLINYENPEQVKKDFKLLAKNREILFLKCNHDKDDYPIMEYAYKEKCVIISNDQKFSEHLSDELTDKEREDWEKWLFLNVKDYDYNEGHFVPWDYRLEYSDITVDYNASDIDDIILLDSDVDMMFSGSSESLLI